MHIAKSSVLSLQVISLETYFNVDLKYLSIYHKIGKAFPLILHYTVQLASIANLPLDHIEGYCFLRKLRTHCTILLVFWTVQKLPQQQTKEYTGVSKCQCNLHTAVCALNTLKPAGAYVNPYSCRHCLYFSQ